MADGTRKEERTTELALLKQIQSVSCPFLDVLFQGITMLGETIPVALILAFTYWCADKRLGLYFMYNLSFSATLNGTIKGQVCRPRPSAEDGIRVLRPETATGLSFPSGHSQNAAVLGASFGFRFKKRIVWIIAVFFLLLVGFSRLYLGAHYPTDVLTGLLLGVFSAFGGWLFFRKERTEKAQNLLFFCSVLCFLPFAVYYGFLVTPALRAEQADFFKALGLLCGVSVGRLLENRLVGFTTDNLSIQNRVLRMSTGLAGLLLVYLLPKLLLPDHTAVLLLRYFFVSVYTVFLAPFCFKRFKI